MNGEKRAAARVTIDPQVCLGSGTCIAVAPALFEMGDAGTTQPQRSVVEWRKELDEAVSRCPTAIEVSLA